MSLQTDIDTLIDEFDLLDDWEQRYRYLIDMGKDLPPFPEDARNEAHRVKGCVSQVWLIARRDDTNPDIHVFEADSDAHIVRGLAALLIRIYSGRTSAEIRSVDAREVLSRIGLAEHLSPQRSNGLNSMIARIQSEAAEG